MIIASGGFGADFTKDSLIAQYRPDLMHLLTINGEHCTGDGIKMGEAVGAKTIDLEWVQVPLANGRVVEMRMRHLASRIGPGEVHPTGLVKVGDEDAKVKFLAAEALRGVPGGTSRCIACATGQASRRGPGRAPSQSSG